MEHVIQAELRTGTTHTVTWLGAALRPKPGWVVLYNDDPRLWTVMHAYNIMARETTDYHAGWKVNPA